MCVYWIEKELICKLECIVCTRGCASAVAPLIRAVITGYTSEFIPDIVYTE